MLEEMLEAARSTGRASLGTYAAAELATVGFPVPQSHRPGSLAVSRARKAMRERGLAVADEHGQVREPAGALADWRELNTRTRGLLVLLSDLDGSQETRTEVHALVEPADLVLSYAVSGEVHALAVETVPHLVAGLVATVFSAGSVGARHQLVFARPGPERRDVVEVLLQRRDASTVLAQERHTLVDRTLSALAPEAGADRLADWLTELLTADW